MLQVPAVGQGRWHGVRWLADRLEGTYDDEDGGGDDGAES